MIINNYIKFELGNQQHPCIKCMPTQYFSVRPKILTHFPNRHLNFAPVQKSSNKAEKTADGANLLLQEAKVQIFPPLPLPIRGFMQYIQA